MPRCPDRSWSQDRKLPQLTGILQYRLPGPWLVLAGRSDIDNDRLSTTLADPDDWWFHVRGMPGSHVLLKARPGFEPDRETLRRAAAIAAYLSKARGGGVVSVSATQARYVRKPSGAKAGTVTIRRETVYKVRPALPPADEADECAHAPAA
jgi:predicted ribosome quality control (RQC) complex YloA/Tae2 family protein